MDLNLPGGPFATVFDVGGSVGDFAAEAYYRWPAAAIYSFEPLGDVAFENASRAKGRWTTCAFAIADAAGRRTMTRNLVSSEASTLLEPGPARREAFGIREHHEPVEVEVRTLDELVHLIEAPALLKVAAEGAEMLVLEGGRQAVPMFDVAVLELSRPGCFVAAPLPFEVDAEMLRLGFVRRAFAGELLDPYDAVYSR